jgi:hypothetical protein
MFCIEVANILGDVGAISTLEGVEAIVKSMKYTIVVHGAFQASAEPENITLPLLQFFLVKRPITTTYAKIEDSSQYVTTWSDVLEASLTGLFGAKKFGSSFVPTSNLMVTDTDDSVFVSKKVFSVPNELIQWLNRELGQPDGAEYVSLFLVGKFEHACDLDIAVYREVDYNIGQRQIDFR